MKRRLFLAVFLWSATGISSVQAEVGESFGVDELSDSWGPSWGNGYASLQFNINSYAGYGHDSNGFSWIRGASWTTPTAHLLGARVTFWDVSGDALAIRHGSDHAQSGTAALGKVMFGGTVYYDCFNAGPRYLNECRGTRSIARTFVRGEIPVTIAGVIPATFGGSVHGNFSGGVTGRSTMNPFSLNGNNSASDRVTGGFTAGGAVVGTAWALLGIKPLLSVGLHCRLDFVRLTASGPLGMAERDACRIGAYGCSSNNRARYQLTTKGFSTEFRSFDGRLYFEACVVGFCGDEELLRWSGWRWGNIDHYNATRSERFASSY